MRKIGIIVVDEGCEGRIAARHVLINALRDLESQNLNFGVTLEKQNPFESEPLKFKIVPPEFFENKPFIEPEPSKYIGKPKQNFKK